MYQLVWMRALFSFYPHLEKGTRELGVSFVGECNPIREYFTFMTSSSPRVLPTNAITFVV